MDTPVQPSADATRRWPPDATAYGERMIYGLGIFFFVAILLIAAFVKVKKRDAAYGRGEGFEE